MRRTRVREVVGDVLRGGLRASRIAARSAALVAGLRLAERRHGASAQLTGEYVQRWARAMIDALAVDATVTGRVDATHGMVVANHRSFIDIPLLLAIVGGQILSRGDVESWPILGKLASIGGTIYVDRDDKSNGARAVKTMVSRLRAQGRISVFAEGTTYTDDMVRPFLAGAFLAARAAKVPITPIGLAYERRAAMFGDETFGAHAQNLFSLPRVAVAVAIGEPIEPGGASTGAVALKVRDAVQALVDQARTRLPFRG